MRHKIVAGLAFAILAAAPSVTSAASLTRSSCWVASWSDGSKRTVCFLDSGRLTMTNEASTTDHKWSTCRFAGKYVRSGNAITIRVPKNSGKCTNGANSPNYNATCDFTGEELMCKGGSVVDGKKYNSSLTLK